jgi:hypothetical protein
MPVYDYNGKVFEMDETDPAAARAKIQAALGETAAPATAPPQEFGVQEAVQMALPAAGAVAPGPTGAGKLISDLRGAKVLDPLTQSITGRFGEYVAKPAKAVIDAATMITTGIPGAAPAALYDTYKAAQEAVPRMKQALTSITDLDMPAFNEIFEKLKPADRQALSQLVDQVGAKQALATFATPGYIAQDAKALDALNVLKQQIKFHIYTFHNKSFRNKF